MPLTKQYLRYSPSGTFNIIASAGCNSVWTNLQNQDGRFVASGTCEDITIWDMQRGEKAAVLYGENSEVSCLCNAPNKKVIAAGYRDGSIKTFNIATGEVLTVFSGHKSTVTCLAFDLDGHCLASGSKDTHIVIWDVVAESGISRLSSHTGPVTSLSFQAGNTLVSSSQDTSIKFWDLDTNYCFKTLLGHRTEVWDFVLMQEGKFLVTGCGDSELRVWHLEKKEVKSEDEVAAIDDEENDALSPIKSSKIGSVLRSGTGRVSSIVATPNGNVLGVHGNLDALELFVFLSHLEAAKRLNKRKKRQHKKEGKTVDLEIDETGAATLQDIVKRLPVVKASSKIKAADLVLGKATELRIVLVLNNNTLEVYSVNITTSDAPNFIRRIAQQGHHSEIRSLAFSSDSLAVASGAADAVKLWNRSSLACLRTVKTGYVLSLVFVPGDRHLLAGLQDGRLLIIDVGVGEVIEEIPAHSTEIWSLCLLPNQSGCVSGGGDNCVKWWTFELLKSKEGSGKVLSLLHKRTLTLEDPVLCVRITPDSKLVAVALLDMTIKVFFMDTLKFFLSLYGHKLPVVTMDISHDSTLLVSGSVDRNIKLWGLDFGDCRKSIFAHEAAITCTQFQPDTHYIFSCGKDGRVHQWDADTYDKILTFKSHFGEVWAMAISPNGQHVVSAGSDRCLKLLTRTEEVVVLEDEAEEERAKEEEEQLVTGTESTVKGQGDLKLPSRKTVGAERGAEQLMECIATCQEFEDELRGFKLNKSRGLAPAKPPLMLAYQVDDVHHLLLAVLKRIRASELEEALVLLPFSSACDLLQRLSALLQHGLEAELSARTLTFLLRVHHGPIVGSKELVPLLTSLQASATTRVTNIRDMIGCNLYGMQFLQRDIEQREGVALFRDATIVTKEKARKKKRKERALKRAILSL